MVGFPNGFTFLSDFYKTFSSSGEWQLNVTGILEQQLEAILTGNGSVAISPTTLLCNPATSSLLDVLAPLLERRKLIPVFSSNAKAFEALLDILWRTSSSAVAGKDLNHLTRIARELRQYERSIVKPVDAHSLDMIRTRLSVAFMSWLMKTKWMSDRDRTQLLNEFVNTYYSRGHINGTAWNTFSRHSRLRKHTDLLGDIGTKIFDLSLSQAKSYPLFSGSRFLVPKSNSKSSTTGFQDIREAVRDAMDMRPPLYVGLIAREHRRGIIWNGAENTICPEFRSFKEEEFTARPKDVYIYRFVNGQPKKCGPFYRNVINENRKNPKYCVTIDDFNKDVLFRSDEKTASVSIPLCLLNPWIRACLLVSFIRYDGFFLAMELADVLEDKTNLCGAHKAVHAFTGFLGKHLGNMCIGSPELREQIEGKTKYRFFDKKHSICWLSSCRDPHDSESELLAGLNPKAIQLKSYKDD